MRTDGRAPNHSFSLEPQTPIYSLKKMDFVKTIPVHNPVDRHKPRRLATRSRTSKKYKLRRGGRHRNFYQLQKAGCCSCGEAVPQSTATARMTAKSVKRKANEGGKNPPPPHGRMNERTRLRSPLYEGRTHRPTRHPIPHRKGLPPLVPNLTFGAQGRNLGHATIQDMLSSTTLFFDKHPSR